MKNAVKKIKEKILISTLLVAVFFFCIPGIELIPGTKNIFKSSHAEAAIDYGRESRTAEFILGLGTETATRATGVTSYTSAAGWVTSVPALSSGDVVTLLGKNIHVDSAQLEVAYFATAVTITDQDIYLNVENSSTSGTLVAAGEYSGMAANTVTTGGLTGSLMSMHDVTSFFDRQTDTNFSSGVHIVSSLNVTGPSRFLSSMKLVITYSVDVETISHNLVKTVKLPLLSAANIGTKTAACAASVTCAFTVDLTKIPELTNKSQILSLNFEITALQGATAATSMTLRMTGSGTSNVYTFADTYTDAYSAKIYWNPLSDALFTVGAVNSIDVVNGTNALYSLGGEVSITFSYDASLITQTETVRYFVSQGTVLPAGNLTQLSTSTINIENAEAQIQTAWYHVEVSPLLTTANIVFSHRVSSSLGNSIGTSQTYTISAANVRSANSQMIIHVLDQSSSVYSKSMDIGGQYQFSSVSAASSPAAVSAYITFTYNNSDPLLSKTKTLIFGASQKGSGRNTANNIKTASTIISLAEHAEKRQDSVFVEADYLRHDTTSITSYGNYVTRIGQSTLTIPEGGRIEPHRKRFLYYVSFFDFFGAATTTAQVFPFTISQYYSGADYTYEANIISITYTTKFEIKPDPIPRQTRTVEYILGGGSDNTARASLSTQYFGDNSIGVSPTMLSLQAIGSNVKVASAYIDLSFYISATAAQTTNEMTLTGTISGVGGTVSDVYLHENSGSQLISSGNGNTGYYHGQHDVTSLFGKQNDDGYWNRGDVQVMFGISTNLSTGNRTLTSMKLVVTYETDFTLSWHDEIKTVKIPLQSSDSLGTRSATCARLASCNFTFSKSLPDMVNVVSAYFEMTSSADGTTNPISYISTGGAQSSSFTTSETNNDSTAIRYLWQVPNINLNATTTPNQTGTLVFYNNSGAALNMYGIGGELVITYKYNTASSQQLETVSFSNGQQSTSAFAKTIIGTSTPYIANKNATARDIWIKYYSAPYGTGNLTLYGRVGTSTERSISASNTVGTRSGGDRFYYLNLSQDVSNFNMPTTGIGAYIAFTSASQYPTGAETFVNYVWDGSKYGTSTRTITIPAAQHSATNVTGNAPQVKQADILLSSNIAKTFRGAYSRTYFQHSAAGTYGGTFALGPGIYYGINNATTSISEVGDATPYNSVLINSYTQSNLFGSTLPNFDNFVRVENSAQSANPFKFSNEILVTYDENQDTRRASFTQDMFRIYEDNDFVTPVNPWHSSLSSPLGENQNMTASSRPIRKSDAVRLRLGLTVGTSTLEANMQAFQLQYGAKTTSCSAIDVDWQNVTSGAAWVGYDNPSVASSANISALLLSKSNVGGLYTEGGLTGLNPSQVIMDKMVEYDFSLKRNTALPDTDYCFRVVESSGKKIFGYNMYPVIRTAGYTPETTNWRFYDDELNETPADNPAWTLNSTAISLANNNIIKLRIGLQEVANESGTNERFAVQYSTDPTFSQGVNFIDSQAGCNIMSTFCYADSPSVTDTDDSIISTSKLGLLKGRHNEATSTSTFSPVALTHYEMEYSLKSVRQRTGQVYYFRLWDIKRSSPIAVKSTYSSPSVQAEGASLGVTVSGINKGSVVAENTMSATTTSTTLPFGNLSLDKSVFLGHLLNIKTNAMDGYTVGMYASDNLRNIDGNIIPSINASNSSPNTWENVCLVLGQGCVGYHTTDSALNPIGNPGRFSATNTWAGVSTTTPDEVAYSDLPTNNLGDNVNIIYRVTARTGTAPGDYSTDIVYVVTPVY